MKKKLSLLAMLPFVCTLSIAQDSGAPPAVFKPGAEVTAELDEAARTSTSAAGVSVTITPGISVRRRMRGLVVPLSSAASVTGPSGMLTRPPNIQFESVLELGHDGEYDERHRQATKPGSR